MDEQERHETEEWANKPDSQLDRIEKRLDHICSPEGLDGWLGRLDLRLEQLEARFNNSINLNKYATDRMASFDMRLKAFEERAEGQFVLKPVRDLSERVEALEKQHHVDQAKINHLEERLKREVRRLENLMVVKGDYILEILSSYQERMIRADTKIAGKAFLVALDEVAFDELVFTVGVLEDRLEVHSEAIDTRLDHIESCLRDDVARLNALDGEDDE